MTKKIILFLTLKVCSLVTFFLLALSCSEKGSQFGEPWLLNLLSLVSPVSGDQKNENSFGSENSFKVNSVSPNIAMENSIFSIEGENLKELSEEQLFGEGYSKFLKFTEVSDAKITVSVILCPEESFVFPSSSQSENRITLPCFGSKTFVLRPFKWEQGLPISPTISLFATNSFQTLRNLGEIEFVTKPSLPEGIQILPETGEIYGTPLETTENEFRSYTITAQLKTDPSVKLQTTANVLVVSEIEKNNRTCKPLAVTSTCRGPAPHTCANASVCYTSQFVCIVDSKCGF
ncbi:hypothetical protein EHR01_01020 [Leptospira mtsangambouensis]|uniref:Uncharacterized protein n=1 Tax=Leptospira mtsangambouensis TaxID=2484912 RepID=A0ABY2P1U0_9LEPT|nr:putative Ig domain-containing protein [Leptospira mtsangambouensis]TGM81416.1 hypothetical protein EHR01_01020 [Leptospira mtsangambouensis]